MADSNQQDQSAVAAVRGGDAERYRELVERHERRVFAVAWSRLGDATLAEEATQEAFIRAYRRLWLLGDGAKFSGWISTIARRVAINFGLRHLRELNKRERWALENFDGIEHTGDDADPLHSPETLRQTLAELPAGHRECLVLFYLEGKSGEEAAAVLGISEAALRVRLHRARAAMRERLEEKLEGSLAKLRPAKTLVPAIMAGVLASSSAKAATVGGAGAAVTGVLTKLGFVKWLAGASMNLMLLPMFGLNWWFMRLDLQNFRERDGFRARLYRQNAWVIIVVLMVFFGGYWLLMPAFQAMFRTADARGMRGVSFSAMSLLGVILVSLSLLRARRLQVVWNRFYAGTVFASLLAGIFVLAIAQGWIPIMWVGYFFVLQTLAQMIFFADRPLRTDYNLFLRAVEKILPDARTAVRPTKHFQASGADRFRFARFLGGRWLVGNFRSTGSDLILQMTPVKASFQNLTWNLFFLVSRRNISTLCLRPDGTVTATLHPAGLKLLNQVCPGNPLDRAELETKVAAAVTLAWQKFREGDGAAAERSLGQVPDEEVFLKPARKTWSTQLQRALAFGVAGFLVLQMFYVNKLTKALGGFSFSNESFLQQQYKRDMHDLQKAETPQQRFDALGDAAKRSFETGKVTDARNFAVELLWVTPKYTNDWNYGNAVQDANLVLGRIAVSEGKIAEAKKYLAASGRSNGSPQMNSFGPNMSLALDLLKQGERDAVLEHFIRCRRFWKDDSNKLDRWMHEVMAGKIPDFGANLIY